jgi:hypothetical protein
LVPNYKTTRSHISKYCDVTPESLNSGVDIGVHC